MCSVVQDHAQTQGMDTVRVKENSLSECQGK